MEYVVTKTLCLNDEDFNILNRFENIVDEMNLSAEELSDLLYDIQCRRTRSNGIIINYMTNR